MVLCWSSRGLVVGPFFLEILQMREDQSQRGLLLWPKLGHKFAGLFRPKFPAQAPSSGASSLLGSLRLSAREKPIFRRFFV